MDTGAYCQVLRMADRQGPGLSLRPRARPAPAGDEAAALQPRLLLALDIALSPEEVAEAEAGQVVALGFGALNAALMADLAPDAIALPLLSRHSDALQMLQALAGLGYRGAVRVYAPPLPDHRMVKAELGAVSRALRVSLHERRTP